MTKVGHRVRVAYTLRRPIMNFPRFVHRSFVHWIACFAILLNALAPSVSQAVAWATGEPTGWTQICSLAGSRWVPVTGDADLPAPPAGAGEQCPFCAVHPGSFGFAASAPPSWAPMRFDTRPVTVALIARIDGAPRLHARSRAPPLSV